MKHIVTLLCSVPCECVCFSESVFDSCCYFYCFFGGLFHAFAHVYVCGTGASSSGSFGVLSVSAFVVLISMVFERKRVYSVRACM